MSENGKGDVPRPFSVDRETFASNWERAFGKAPKKDETCEYSGLPTVDTYEESSSVHSKKERQN